MPFYPSMQPGFQLTFPSGTVTSLLTVEAQDSLATAVEQLALPTQRRCLVLIGGASKISQHDFERLEFLFTEVLAPLAQTLNMVVIDGGTDAGVMRLIGNARTKIGGTFPLVGVAPEGLVSLPDRPCNHPEAAPIEPQHTHCLLIPGSNWGDESPWIARLATVIAQDCSSVTVLSNGGSVTWKDAACSIEENRPIVIISGSGRAADIIAAALRGELVEDKRAILLVASGLLQAVDMDSEDYVLANVLRSKLT